MRKPPSAASRHIVLTSPGEPSLSDSELQANRFRLLSRIADDLAHEIKNPLHAMIINLEVLRKRLAAGATEGALQRTDIIEHEIHRVHDMVESVLRLLRPDADGVQPFEVDALLAEVVPLIALQARLARVEFRHESPGEGVIARLRRDHFKFALLNLTDAAFELLRPRGGTLELLADATPAEVRLRVNARPAAGPVNTGVPAGDALAMAAALLRHAGGRVEPAGDGGGGASLAILVLLPRIAAA